jgi:hypothetical protein
MLKRHWIWLKMSKQSSTTFNCFSPPVMLVTLLIEFAAAIYTLYRYKMNTTGRLVVGLLASLATFQLAEYHVCTGYGINAEQWSRLGYASITLLPALGIHLLYVLAQKPSRRVVYAAYGTMAGFVAYFMTYSTAFIGYKCTGNYVIFQIGVGPAIAYGMYYYGWLLAAIILGMRWANDLMQAGKKQLARMQAIRSLIVGYLVFLVPTALANTVKPETRQGIPSIMCGFAVIFALILAGYLLPRAGEMRVPLARLRIKRI